jgi:shikimate kinase
LCTSPRCFSNLDNADNMGDAGSVGASSRYRTPAFMHQHADILLIGPRASGKTTLGQLLARELNRSFADLDVEALHMFNEPTIAQVWQARGEKRWRDAETTVLRSLLNNRSASPRQRMVIALGGGAPMIPAVADMVASARANGVALTVYLACSVQTLQDRLRRAGEAGQSRPPLLGHDAVAEVPAVLALREPTYRGLADIVIDANQPSSINTLKELLAALRTG